MNGDAGEPEEFLDRLEAQFGLVFDEGRKEQVAEALNTRLLDLRLSHREYIRRLDTDKAEWERMVALLTVPESYFFRHPDQLRAFLEVALPARMAAHRHDSTLRILSIGCANGEEPFTVAMILREHEELTRDWKFSIRACDINGEVLQRAQRGIYTSWALRATPQASRQRWFTPVGNRYRLDEEIRNSVSFDTCNAMNLYRPELAEQADIVFFRNVLIYFSPEAIRAAVNAVAHLLAPGGYLFLGPAETLRGVSSDFSLCHTHDTFYYQRKTRIGALVPFSPFHREEEAPGKGPAEAAPDNASPVSRAGIPAATSDPFDTTWTTGWMEEIQRSSDRVRGLHTARVSPAAGGGSARNIGRTAAKISSAEELQRLLSLLSSERYEETLAAGASLPPELQHDPDIQLLFAIAHLNRRETAEAEAACRKVIERDSMNASSHYILALCREHLGDLGAAAEHDRTAIYLDPAFAMPHMHLALIARRRRDYHTARQEFEKANLLLAREDSIRLTMFGGGFSRDALRALCRRELRGLGTA